MRYRVETYRNTEISFTLSPPLCFIRNKRNYKYNPERTLVHVTRSSMNNARILKFYERHKSVVNDSKLVRFRWDLFTLRYIGVSSVVNQRGSFDCSRGPGFIVRPNEIIQRDGGTRSLTNFCRISFA